MNKTEAIQQIILATDRQPIIFTTGYSCRIAAHLCNRLNHFYMTGSMGLAASIGIGVALVTRTPTVVVDGDGSMLMNLSSLAVVGSIPNLSLLHIVLDDGIYASTGGQAVPSKRADFIQLAQASGYLHTFQIEDTNALAIQLGHVLTHCSSPIFIHCVINDERSVAPSRIDPDLGRHQRQFSQYLRTCNGSELKR